MKYNKKSKECDTIVIIKYIFVLILNALNVHE